MKEFIDFIADEVIRRIQSKRDEKLTEQLELNFNLVSADKSDRGRKEFRMPKDQVAIRKDGYNNSLDFNIEVSREVIRFCGNDVFVTVTTDKQGYPILVFTKSAIWKSTKMSILKKSGQLRLCKKVCIDTILDHLLIPKNEDLRNKRIWISDELAKNGTFLYYRLKRID